MRLVRWMLPMLAAGAMARAEPVCAPVAGTVNTTFVQQGCTSPFGICTVGTVDAGALSGTSTFTATSVQVRGAMLFFAGVFNVTTAEGTATYETVGALNSVTGRYTETFRLVSGTGAFEGASGNLFSTGFATGTGFTGSLQGALCGA